MFQRIFAFLILLTAALAAGDIMAQSIPELEDRLHKTDDKNEQWAIAFNLSKNLISTDHVKAALYADRALQAALSLQDKQKEAEAAIVGADIAARNNRNKEALSLYARAREAALAAGATPIVQQSVEKLRDINAAQGNYKAAYDWSGAYVSLLRENSRRYAEEQRRKHQEAQEALAAQKNRESQILMAALAGLLLVMTFFYYTRQRANRRIAGELAEKNAMIEEKRRRSEQLLLNILPPAVAAELTVRNKVAARRYEHATVMFIDFVGFTRAAEHLQPEELITELDYCFSRFDEIIGRNRVEKIKTVGDAYICASGLSDRNERPADMIRIALQIQDFLHKLREKRIAEARPYFEARIGIHFGPVVAGVVGTKKFAYDIWGDTVNTAARMEEACEPGLVNVSGAAYEVVKSEFEWRYRGKIATKNKVEMEMWYALAK
ncbi:MAG: adenylate/guanylate cyclase domain-containing protein [Lewinellaceae bacterium]|nr:adenylate/guanylate cyclase domain-containing protein [Lewinellaceae bacterium]